MEAWFQHTHFRYNNYTLHSNSYLTCYCSGVELYSHVTTAIRQIRSVLSYFSLSGIVGVWLSDRQLYCYGYGL